MYGGKTTAVALVADFTGERLCPPFQFALNRSGIAELAARVHAVSETADRHVQLVRRSGGQWLSLAAGRTGSVVAWEAVEFNPAHVAEQRRTNGKRGVKTDVVDATAMFDLLVAGHGSPVGAKSPAITELAAWARHRRGRAALRRDVTRHLVSLLDRAFVARDLRVSAQTIYNWRRRIASTVVWSRARRRPSWRS